jgi:hypothetical protein
MNLTEQEANYVLQAVMQRPLAEALPIFLKMTNQKLVPADALVTAANPALRAVDSSV